MLKPTNFFVILTWFLMDGFKFRPSLASRQERSRAWRDRAWTTMGESLANRCLKPYEAPKKKVTCSLPERNFNKPQPKKMWPGDYQRKRTQVPAGTPQSEPLQIMHQPVRDKDRIQPCHCEVTYSKFFYSWQDQQTKEKWYEATEWDTKVKSIWCETCQQSLNGPQQFHEHVDGKHHREKLKKLRFGNLVEKIGWRMQQSQWKFSKAHLKTSRIQFVAWSKS